MGPYFLKNLIYVGKNPSTNTVELHVRENVQCNHWTNLKLTMESDKVENWVLNIAKVGCLFSFLFSSHFCSCSDKIVEFICLNCL